MTRAFWLGQVIRELGHEVQIVGAAIRERHVYPAPPSGLSVVEVSGDRFEDLAPKLIEKAEGDVVYAVKPRRFSFGVALLWRKKTNRPVILDIDDWEHGALSGFDASPAELAQRILLHPIRSTLAMYERLARASDSNRRLEGTLLERATHRADAITVNSMFLQKRYGGEYLPSGKDTKLFDPARFDAEAARHHFGLSRYRVLLFPGTPQPHKGLVDLLCAVRELDWPDLRLVLVGGRATESHERLLKEWGRWIVVLPRMAIEEMPEVIAAAHVVVVPQRDTPTARAQSPMKLTDGMAMAKPILATRVGDIPKVLAETGYLVKPSSPEELAEKLRYIFENPEETEARGQRARARCIEHYSLESAGKVVSKVLEGLK